MSKLFENRITETGKQAIQDATDYVACELEGAVEVHGEESPEAVQLLLGLVTFQQIVGTDDEIRAQVERYVVVSEKIYGRDSLEVANGFMVLARHHGLKRQAEECFSAIEKVFSFPETETESLSIDPILKALFHILEKLQENPAKDQRLGIVLAVHTLSWLATLGRAAPSYPIFLERIRPTFQSLGFRRKLWEWLLRRCDPHQTHFIGLISVLLEEDMFFPEAGEINYSNENDLEEADVRENVDQEPTEMLAGFSESFPESLLGGELSVRVERLLEEGRRHVSSTGYLKSVFLVFSTQSAGDITQLEVCGGSGSVRELGEEMISRVIARNGAESVMMLALTGLSPDHIDKTGNPAREALLVMARDAKSSLFGFQPIQVIDDKDVFDEPQILVMEEDEWFPEFTFPVKPRTNKSRRKSPKKKAKRGK